MRNCFKVQAMMAVLSLLMLPFSSSSVQAQEQGIPVPKLQWKPCLGDKQKNYQCAGAEVPMDYAKPDGRTFNLALIKAPALDPAKRLGTLFWNPGGPGDSGTEYLPVALDGFPQQVRQRFDIVSWDPRGMGGDTSPVVRCFDSEQEETEKTAQWFANQPDIAVSDKELAAAIKAHARLNRQCVKHAGDLLTHVSTADNARDLDLLRQAVGEEKLYYYGTSYGTFLGATYLNMFPQRIKAVVLDGAVEPKAWIGNDGNGEKLSTFIRVGSDTGALETIQEFMRQCGKVSETVCGFSAGSPEATLEKWEALLRRAKAKPINVEGGDITDRGLLAFISSKIFILRKLDGFDRFPGWYEVGQFLKTAWASSEGHPAPPQATPPQPPKTTQAYTHGFGRQAAVICGESPNPVTVKAQAEQAKISFARTELNSWPFLANCIGWTVKSSNVYLGPWNNPTPPVLVIGNTFDPATPYSSSKKMAEELANGHFLTVDGFGHSVLLNPSQCAKDYVAAYLIEGKLPPENTRCPQEGSPFPH